MAMILLFKEMLKGNVRTYMDGKVAIKKRMSGCKYMPNISQTLESKL